MNNSQTPPISWPQFALLLFIPLLLLAGVIALFLVTDGAGLNVESVVPIESLEFEQTVLRPGEIEFQVRNTSPEAITIAQININDGFVRFEMTPSQTLARLEEGRVIVPYPWTEGEAYEITLFSSNSVPFPTAIEAAAETKTVSNTTLLSFTLIGIYVGVIPVALGMFWFPALKRLGHQWFIFLMAVTVGLLIYLGIDATSEALELANEVGGLFQGVGLVGLGIVATFMLLDAIGQQQNAIERNEADRRLAIAFLIAIGIGLHNLGEGLAIGAAYSIGSASLGTFLVVGFILQNITEGLGIIAPVLRDKPPLSKLIWMGVIGGFPAVVGAWIGGLTFSKPLAIFFLAIGAGAVFEVVYEIGKLIRRDIANRPMPMTIFSGITCGMLLLYVTGLLIK